MSRPVAPRNKRSRDVAVPSVNLTKSSMAETMLWGMLLMAMCFWMYAIAVALMRVRTIMLERERHTDWVKAELAGGEK